MANVGVIVLRVWELLGSSMRGVCWLLLLARVLRLELLLARLYRVWRLEQLWCGKILSIRGVVLSWLWVKLINLLERRKRLSTW
jgi:hypothetical protein